VIPLSSTIEFDRVRVEFEIFEIRKVSYRFRLVSISRSLERKVDSNSIRLLEVCRSFSVLQTSEENRESTAESLICSDEVEIEKGVGCSSDHNTLLWAGFSSGNESKTSIWTLNVLGGDDSTVAGS